MASDPSLGQQSQVLGTASVENTANGFLNLLHPCSTEIVPVLFTAYS